MVQRGEDSERAPTFCTRSPRRHPATDIKTQNIDRKRAVAIVCLSIGSQCKIVRSEFLLLTNANELVRDIPSHHTCLPSLICLSKPPRKDESPCWYTQ